MLNAPALALSASGLRYTLPGSRANSMGTAFTSIASDPYNLYYNPAGLSAIEDREIAGDMGRRFSLEHGAGEISFIFVRPQPERKNEVAAIGFYGIRQGNLAKKDMLNVGYSGVKTIKYFQKPLRWGIAGKIIRCFSKDKNNIGLGASGGVLFESEGGLSTSFVIDNLTIGIRDSMMLLTIGNSLRHKTYTFSLDFKIRKGKSEFFPGIEKSFLNDLIRIRAGKGFPLAQEDYLALGGGVNLLPYIIDFSVSVPWKGLSENAGYFSMGLTYKFGGGDFSDKLVGNASVKFKNLQKSIDDLRTRKAELGTQVATIEVNKNILQSEVTVLRSRQVELENTLKNLEIEIARAQYSKKEPRRKQVKKILKKRTKWPKKYRVQKGDTLRSISSKFYGSASLWETIYESNEKKIFRGLPVEGSVLIIPPPPKLSGR